MSETNVGNPLYAAQREKVGANTFEDYDYQYHWALYRVLSKHKQLREYAVFIELHEDVVVADSLKAENANFEFNQVKTTGTKFTSKKLLEKKRGKGASVLGKLISSCAQKKYESQISQINLVALNGFNLELKEEGVSLNKITLDDLSESQYNKLEDAIIEELALSSLPANIQFIVPDLSEKNFQNDIISTIAKLTKTLYPNSFSDPLSIYRLLIDELHQKGRVTYDFAKWNDLLSQKALTSITVSSVIYSFTSIKDEAKIDLEFNDICKDLEITAITKKILKRSLGRYRLLRISNDSTNQIDITKTIVDLLNQKIDNGIDNLKELFKTIIDDLPIDIKQQFPTESDLKGAIICEYIMME